MLIRCPHCDRTAPKIPAEWAGKTVRCQGCQKSFRLPTIVEAGDEPSMPPPKPAATGEPPQPTTAAAPPAPRDAIHQPLLMPLIGCAAAAIILAVLWLKSALDAPPDRDDGITAHNSVEDGDQLSDLQRQVNKLASELNETRVENRSLKQQIGKTDADARELTQARDESDRIHKQLEDATRQVKAQLDQATRQDKERSDNRPSSAPARREPWRDVTRWRRLRRGMTANEVRAIFGEPHRVNASPELTTWYYGEAGGGLVFIHSDDMTVYGWSEP
jgi:hypothetical protein